MSNELFDIWSAMRKSSFQRTLDNLDDIVSTVNGDPQEIIRICLEKASQTMKCEVSSFWILRENGDGMIFPAAFIGKSDISNIRVFPGEGIVGKVIGSGNPLIIEDCQKSSFFNSNVDKKTGFITKSMICVPCTISKTTFGCIQMINRIDDTLFDNEDLEMVTSISNKIVEILVKYKVLGFYGYDFEKKKREIGGTVEKTSLMVIDIQGFNSISKTIEPEILAQIMNYTTSFIANTIKKYNGYIDKTFNDSLLAYWKESDDGNASYNACKAALEIVKNDKEALMMLKEKYDLAIQLNASIYNGESYIGYFGDGSLLNDSPIGKGANLAFNLSRNLVKDDILIGREVLDAVERDGYRVNATYKTKIEVADGKYDDIYKLNDIF